MRNFFIAGLLAILLAGCGSHLVQYTPQALPQAERSKAAEFVEQGFYEDFGKQRPAGVVVTDKYILLSDGVVSKTSSFGSAMPLGIGAIAAGDSTTITKEAGQRLYFNSMGAPTIHQKNLKEGRFVVIIRGLDGSTMRYVNARSLDQAARFADAVETLRQAAATR